MMNWKIRIATPQDASLLAVLGAQTFRDTYQNITEDDKKNMDLYIQNVFQTDKIKENILHEHIIYLLAENDTEAVGYVKLIKNKAPEQLEGKKVICLDKIYVLQSTIGQGIGKLLMGKVCEIAIEEGFEWIWLCVWKINEKAIGFYQKFGFVLQGEVPFQMGGRIDMDWLMVKNLNQ